MSDNPSCRNCPSFLTSGSAFQKYGRSVGSPICARFGTILGRPGMEARQEKKLQEHIAGNCPAFGEPMPAEPGRNHLVMLPDPVARTLTTDAAKRDAVESCAMCSKFVNEQTVSDELGWSAGLCSAKGKLLMSNRLRYEARDCEYREYGMVRTSIGGMHFLPEYEESFGAAAANPVAAYFAAKASGFVDPNDYPTDREVEEGDRSAGIQAWRKIDDPDGSGNSVYLPIYDRSFFDDEERALIPQTGSDEHPELYVDHFGGVYGLAVAWMELDETPCMWGEPGVGKTELFRHVAWLMQVPFRRISITNSTEIEDIAGKMLYSPEKGTYFQYGRLAIAWTRPGVVVVDEPNTGRPDVWQFIRPMTDNSKQLVLDMNEAESLTRNQDCFPGLAMNPAWDPRNVGALEIADADANRLFHTFIEMPPETLEREIIQERVRLDGWELSTEQMDAIIKTAQSLRSLSVEEGLPITWAIRQQIKVARALRWFSPTTAYLRAAGDFLEPEAREVLLDQVRANFEEE